MKNNLTILMEKLSEIEKLGIYIESLNDIVGPIFTEEESETISGKKEDIGKYLYVNVSLMIPLDRKSAVIKEFKDLKKEKDDESKT